MYNTKGASTDGERREIKITLMNKIQQEEKRKQILKIQYEKSLETIGLIK
jgi:coiled-coil domain-containing protein 63/114